VSNPVPETPSAAPEETGTKPTAAAPTPERATVARRSRPKRPVGNEGEASRSSRSAEARGERSPGDNVADMLNAREMNRLTGDAGPGPVARPYGPPAGYPRPPVYGPPGYGPPPGYAPYPPPPPMMRAPY
jgi:hypothetical protein